MLILSIRISDFSVDITTMNGYNEWLHSDLLVDDNLLQMVLVELFNFVVVSTSQHV